MPAVTRLGDSTTGTCDLKLSCCPHGRSGSNGSTSHDVYVNGLGLHRLSDTGPTNCPHGGTFKTVSGSATVYCNGLPVTRVGDTTQCVVCGQSGSHTSGSGNVFVGG